MIFPTKKIQSISEKTQKLAQEAIAEGPRAGKALEELVRLEGRLRRLERGGALNADVAANLVQDVIISVFIVKNPSEVALIQELRGLQDRFETGPVDQRLAKDLEGCRGKIGTETPQAVRASIRALIQSALRACDRERRNSPDAPTSEFLYRSMDAIYLAVQLETDPSIARKLLTDDKAVFDWFERGRDRFTQKWDRPEIFEVDAESRLEGEAFEAVKADAVGSLRLAQSNELKRCSEIDRAALLISQKKTKSSLSGGFHFSHILRTLSLIFVDRGHALLPSTIA